MEMFNLIKMFNLFWKTFPFRFHVQVVHLHFSFCLLPIRKNEWHPHYDGVVSREILHLKSSCLPLQMHFHRYGREQPFVLPPKLVVSTIACCSNSSSGSVAFSSSWRISDLPLILSPFANPPGDRTRLRSFLEESVLEIQGYQQYVLR